MKLRDLTYTQQQVVQALRAGAHLHHMGMPSSRTFLSNGRGQHETVLPSTFNALRRKNIIGPATPQDAGREAKYTSLPRRYALVPGALKPEYWDAHAYLTARLAELRASLAGPTLSGVSHVWSQADLAMLALLLEGDPDA